MIESDDHSTVVDADSLCIFDPLLWMDGPDAIIELLTRGAFVGGSPDHHAARTLFDVLAAGSGTDVAAQRAA